MGNFHPESYTQNNTQRDLHSSLHFAHHKEPVKWFRHCSVLWTEGVLSFRSVQMGTWCAQAVLSTCSLTHVSKKNRPRVLTAAVRSVRVCVAGTWQWRKPWVNCHPSAATASNNSPDPAWIAIRRKNARTGTATPNDKTNTWLTGNSGVKLTKTKICALLTTQFFLLYTCLLCKPSLFEFVL